MLLLDVVLTVRFRRLVSCNFVATAVPLGVWKARRDNKESQFNLNFKSLETKQRAMDTILLLAAAAAAAKPFDIPEGTITWQGECEGEGDDSWEEWGVDKTTVKTVTIPDSVTSIGQFAFSGCSSLVTLTIPDSVTFIGHHAFNGCSSLVTVTIPDSVTFIERSAWPHCWSRQQMVVVLMLAKTTVFAAFGTNCLRCQRKAMTFTIDMLHMQGKTKSSTNSPAHSTTMLRSPRCLVRCEQSQTQPLGQLLREGRRVKGDV